jgi:hypothetical protein
VRVHEQVLDQVLFATQGLNIFHANISNKSVRIIDNADSTDSLRKEN